LKANAFEDDIKESLKAYQDSHEQFWWSRLFDTRSFRFISERMFANRQPADFIALHNSIVYFLECKMSHNPTSYAFTYIQPHQLESLLRIWDCGGQSYLLINDRSRRGNFHTYLVKPYVMLANINKHLSCGRKSIKWEELAGISTELPRTGGLWDMSQIFNLSHNMDSRSI
jgi:penicillin-binding protein-related factor A (putative recombinase)